MEKILKDMEKFEDLKLYIHSQLEKRGQDIPLSDLAFTMVDYAMKFDISSMYRFKEWMLDNGYGDDDIMSALVHDLNDRNEVCFSPRTSSY